MNIVPIEARRFTLGLCCLLAGLAAPAAARATVPPSLLRNLQWRSIGPFRGGRVLAVAGAPDDPQKFYFGAVNGGVWRTLDAGRTWEPIFDSAPVGSIGDLAVAPGAPDTIYVGTGEADMRSDIAQGTGLYRTTDGGAHWAPIGLADTQQIGRILVDPRDATTVLVAALGHPYGPNAMRGVFRSTDGGETWAKTLFRDNDTGAIDMAFEPGHPDVVYAALWQTRRPPWNVYPPSTGPGGGLYKSIDGGRTWSQLTGHGLPAAFGRIGLATTPANPARVYALIDTKPGGGLYRSDDHGATWTRVSGDARITERAWYFSGITADPADADTVYVCDTILLRSSDGGRHFAALKGDPTGDDFHTLWIDPKNAARRILGVDQGTLVTLNGGQTWSSWYNQPTGQFYHVITDNRFPYRVYGAQQDSGAAGVPSRTDAPDGPNGDGINMTEFHETAAGGESDNIAPDPDDPETVYGGRVDKLDLRSHQLRSIDPTLAFPDEYRATWTLPLVFGPLDRALYFANQRIFRTRDGGGHWQPISPDLTRDTLTVPATLDAPTAADTAEAGPRRGVVYAVAPSPLRRDLIWAGTDDGLVWRSDDDGAHWRNVTPAALSPWSKIGVVEASHFAADTAFIAVDRHRLDDFAPYIYRTDDGGKTWRPIARGIADGGTLNAVNVVREDPARRDLLYAGTERGFYVSFDGGAGWQPLQRNLPRTSVRDITVHGADIVIATHGRGFYILDDAAPLRDLAAGAAIGPDGLRLFAPSPAIRLHPPRFTGTPMPKDEPMAPNPPDGAIFDYALAADAKTPLELTITDATGALVRRYRSTDVPAKPDPDKITEAPEWLPRNDPPASTQGAHRFTWDLHYTKPPELSGGDPEPQGIWAPPGTYTVSIAADGHAARQAFQVLPDPRLKLAPGDLPAQFALAQQVQALRVAARAALRQAAALRASVAGRPQAASLQARINAIAGEPYDPYARAPARRHLDTISDLSARLDKLALAVDGADAAPTQDARQSFSQIAMAMQTALAAWDKLNGDAGH
jgi:photosystem II stability/assembly factor-like uncharacterized protein